MTSLREVYETLLSREPGAERSVPFATMKRIVEAANVKRLGSRVQGSMV